VDLIDTESLPVLEGWISLPDAADLLGKSRKRIYQMAREKDKNGKTKLQTVHRLGLRPLLVVREAEILKLKKEAEAKETTEILEDPDTMKAIREGQDDDGHRSR